MSETQRAVLVVDDDAGVLQTLAAMVAYHGYRAVPAAGGAEAVEACRRHRPELVAAVLDVQMPGLDGPATLDALRAAGSRVPFLFVSGHTGAYSDADLLARGAVAVLRKPIALDRLGAALADAVAGSTAG